MEEAAASSRSSSSPPSWTGLLAAHTPSDPLFVHPMSVVKEGEAEMRLHLRSVDLSYHELKAVHSDPPVFRIAEFLTAAVCDRMIRNVVSGRGFAVGKSATHGGSTVRSSSSWLLQNCECSELLLAATMLTGVSRDNFEAVQILRYRTGESFGDHLDYLPTMASRGSQGNRIATLLVYLNSPGGGAQVGGGGGGETRFRDLGLAVSPQMGSALLFFPTFAASGECDFRTIHSGVALGADMSDKWVAQVFMRQGAFSAVERAASFYM